MINVIALTQFAFLTLGIVFLKIMIHAHSDLQVSGYLQSLNRIALWFFATPIVWIAFASLCSRIDRAPLTPRMTYWVGIIIAVLCFLFPATVTLLPPFQRPPRMFCYGRAGYGAESRCGQLHKVHAPRCASPGVSGPCPAKSYSCWLTGPGCPVAWTPNQASPAARGDLRVPTSIPTSERMSQMRVDFLIQGMTDG